MLSLKEAVQSYLALISVVWSDSLRTAPSHKERLLRFSAAKQFPIFINEWNTKHLRFIGPILATHRKVYKKNNIERRKYKISIKTKRQKGISEKIDWADL
jgi:hypothetical protein